MQWVECVLLLNFLETKNKILARDDFGIVGHTPILNQKLTPQFKGEPGDI